MSKVSIEQLMLERGLVQQSELGKAQHIQQQSGGRLGDILIAMGVLTEEKFQIFLAQLYKLDYYALQDLMDFPFDSEMTKLIPYQIALNYLVFPLFFDETSSTLTLASLGPLPKGDQQLMLEQTGTQKLSYALATRQDLQRAIRYHYGKQMWQKAASEDAYSSQDPNRNSRNILALRREQLCHACGYPYDEGEETCSSCYAPLDEAGDDPLIGKVVGDRWRLIRKLGKGGMGLVYLGYDKDTQKQSAVKLLHTDFKEGDEAHQRFFREAQILRRMHHVNIIKVYEFGLEEKLDLGFYLAMEFLTGCSFDEYLELFEDRGEDIPLNVICKILAQVCDAMEHSHEQGVIHRDLKPDNIYLVGGPTRIESVKVLDFGIARYQSINATRVTQHGATLGTPQYLSPEQAIAGDIDHRSDIYSLSVLLFEIMTGQPLFEADSPYQYLMRHVYTTPRTLSSARPDLNISETLDLLVAQGLSKKAEDRPPSMREFKFHMLQGFKAMGVEIEGLEAEGNADTGTYNLRRSYEGTSSSTHPIPKLRSSKEVCSPVSPSRPGLTREPSREQWPPAQDSILPPAPSPAKSIGLRSSGKEHFERSRSESLVRAKQAREDRGRYVAARALREEFLTQEKRARFRRRLTVILLLAILGGGGAFGYRFYQEQSKVTPKAQAHAKQSWSSLKKISFYKKPSRYVKKRKPPQHRRNHRRRR